jgi:hypothetical protein
VVDVTVVDLSHDGCGVFCAAGLQPGETLNLAVLRRGSVAATVRWAADGKAGLSFTSPACAAAGADLRRQDRISVAAEVGLRRAGKLNYRVRIDDITPEGCKAEFVDRPDLYERLWVKFDGMEAIDAEVRWIAGARTGIKFNRPIHAAVFDMLVKKLGAAT